MLNLTQRTNNSVQLPAEIDKAFYLNTDGDLVTKDQNGNIQYVTLSNTKPPKVYKALLSQSGTDAPTAIVLENTLGGEVVWSYENVGFYTATLSSGFGDTFVYFTPFSDEGIPTIMNYFKSSISEIGFFVFTDGGLPANYKLNLTPILIEVYP